MKAVVLHEWSARLALCQWIRDTLDKESVWDGGCWPARSFVQVTS